MTEWITIKECAEIIGCSGSAVRYYIKRGDLETKTEKIFGIKTRTLIRIEDAKRVFGEKGFSEI